MLMLFRERWVRWGPKGNCEVVRRVMVKEYSKRKRVEGGFASQGNEGEGGW